MRLKAITLRDYRNYSEAYIEPCEGVTVFMGDNAQGKTNILEAVYLCCTGRSHRTSRDRELIRMGQDTAYVKATGVRADGTHEVEIALNQAGKRRIKVNGSPVGRSGELLGHITGVLFSPEDLRMVKDGPAVRRRFIDMELSQLRPAYYYALQRYNRALKQRNALLKDCALNDASVETLDLWDSELALSGSEIIHSRKAFCERLNECARKIHSSITNGAETLEIKYEPNVAPGESTTETAECIKSALISSRESDLRRAATGKGAHHDDMGIYIGDMDARLYGSQGQVRTCALSLKLSEIEIISAESGEAPVLMLDDVMSELDAQRRAAVVSFIEEGIQTIITTTNLGYFSQEMVDAAKVVGF